MGPEISVFLQHNCHTQDKFTKRALFASLEGKRERSQLFRLSAALGNGRWWVTRWKDINSGFCEFNEYLITSLSIIFLNERARKCQKSFWIAARLIDSRSDFVHLSICRVVKAGFKHVSAFVSLRANNFGSETPQNRHEAPRASGNLHASLNFIQLVPSKTNRFASKH